MTRALADRGADSRIAGFGDGLHDGARRNHFFWGVRSWGDFPRLNIVRRPAVGSFQRRPLTKEKTLWSCQFSAALQNPTLKRFAIDVKNLSIGAYFEPCQQCWLRKRFRYERRRLGLCRGNKQMRSVETALGPNVNAVPLSLRIRHGNRAPFRHSKIITQ
jgi:hypothetical protein